LEQVVEQVVERVLERVVERVGDWCGEGVTCDVAERVVRNVALVGPDSRNGYRYSEAALAAGVSLYEGKPVFLDHARNVSRPHDRSARDLVGTVVNARFEEGRIRGDIAVLATEAGQTFLALAESRSKACGMSHVVVVERGAEGVVTALVEVVSVDAVAFPATNATFAEQTGRTTGTDESSWETAWEQLSQERDRLAARVESLEREVTLEAVWAREGVSLEGHDEFRRLAGEVREAGLRERLVRERASWVRRRKPVGPVSRGRGEAGVSVERRLVEAIKGKGG
jgi:hypothetical protein